jgi:adenosylcobyric acid synthase
VLPWISGLSLDVEDSLGLPAAGESRGATEPELTVAVVRFPLISNVTDLDALAAEPGVGVRFVDRPEQLSGADLVVLPGTRATVADLRWLRTRGLDTALTRRAHDGGPILGICGGYQMLGESILDEVESGAGQVDGLAILPTKVRFAQHKTLGRPRGSAYGHEVIGYEIHHGITTPHGGSEFLDGVRVGATWGTTWHGVLENDDFRRAFLADVASITGAAHVARGAVSFASTRERQLDLLGDLVADHLDTDALWRIIAAGAPAGLPFVAPGAPRGGWTSAG